MNPEDFWLQYFARPYDEMQSYGMSRLQDAERRRNDLITQRDALDDNTWGESGASFGAAFLPFLAGAIGGNLNQGLEWGARSGLGYASRLEQDEERKRAEYNRDIGLADAEIKEARQFGDTLSANKYKAEAELGMNYLMGKFPGTDPYETEQDAAISKARAIYGSRTTADERRLNEPLTNEDIEYLNKEGNFNLKPGDTVGDYQRKREIRQSGQRDRSLDLLERGEDRRSERQTAELGGEIPKQLDADTSKALRGAMAIEPVMAPFLKKYEEFRATLPEGTPSAYIYNAVMASIPTTEQSKFRKWLRGEGLQTAVSIMGSAGLSEREGQTIANAYSDEFAVDDSELFEAMAALKARARGRAESALTLALSQPQQKLNATSAAASYLATLPPDEQEEAKRRIFIKPVEVPGIETPKIKPEGAVVGPRTPEERAAFEEWKRKKGVASGN